MIKRMSFGGLKASFSRRTRRRPRSSIISCSSDGGVQSVSANANGAVMTGVENKDGEGGGGSNEGDAKQRSSAIKSKHKGKKGNNNTGSQRGGIWKTLRHKLSKNHRQCWDASGSNTELDVDLDAEQQPKYRNNKPKPSSVCPMQPGAPGGCVPPSLHVRPAAATSTSHPVVSSSGCGGGTSVSTEEGVYDEPSFPTGAAGMNLSRVVGGACVSDALGCSAHSGGGAPKTKSRTGDCCQVGSKTRLEYPNPGPVDAASGMLSNNVEHRNGVDVVVSPTSSGLSTPAHEFNNALALSRLNPCALAAASSMSSFGSQMSPTFMLDFRLENAGGNNGTPKIRSLTRELFKLSKYGWYWGPITRTEAEEKLMDQPDGAFLVRDSSDDRHLLSLSFRSYGKTLHTRIEHCNGLFSFYAQPEPEGHTSIVDLIEHSMNYSQSGAFCYSRARSPGSPSFPVRLTKPVSRFTQVRTLQYLCRFIIRQYTRFDHIQELPLPSRIKGYIEEGHY